jgi:hypothetical protein
VQRPPPSSAALSPAAVAKLEREWERWDAEYGFAWRTLAGVPTPADRVRLEPGEQAGNRPTRPGFELEA